MQNRVKKSQGLYRNFLLPLHRIADLRLTSFLSGNWLGKVATVVPTDFVVSRPKLACNPLLWQTQAWIKGFVFDGISKIFQFPHIYVHKILHSELPSSQSSSYVSIQFPRLLWKPKFMLAWNSFLNQRGNRLYFSTWNFNFRVFVFPFFCCHSRRQNV